MIQIVYYCLFLIGNATALIDWRLGVIACMIFDGIRDPVRKVTPDYPIAITLSVVGLWLATFLGACLHESERLRLAMRFYPQSRTAAWSIMLALVPAGIYSGVSYPDGWILAGVGTVSYLFPIIGLTVGLAYVRSGRNMLVPLAWYCVINGVLLIGAVLEFLHYPLAGLRGMGVHWLRHQTGYAIDLISGFYRSPDLLGLHAANVLMFSSILTMRSKSKTRWFWIPLALFSAWCLLVCGRRKMIVMPFFFFAIVLLHGMLRGRVAFLARAGAVAAVVLGLVSAFFPSDSATNYIRFAETSKSEGWDRFSNSGIGGFIASIQQTGVMGLGLGTATQGGRQVATHDAHVWQEDGISRLGVEFGIPGTFFIACAMFALWRAVYKAVRSMPLDSRASTMQFDFLGLIAANVASFSISHQAFSGDPSSIAIAALSLGYVLALPLLGEEARTAAQRTRSNPASWLATANVMNSLPGSAQARPTP